MTINISDDIVKKILEDTGVEDVNNLTYQSLLAFLKEKKRKVQRDILQITHRYNIETAESLEKEIKNGKINEHPAWEDAVVLENLEERLKSLGNDISTLQKTR